MSPQKYAAGFPSNLIFNLLFLYQLALWRLVFNYSSLLWPSNLISLSCFDYCLKWKTKYKLIPSTRLTRQRASCQSAVSLSERRGTISIANNRQNQLQRGFCHLPYSRLWPRLGSGRQCSQASISSILLHCTTQSARQRKWRKTFRSPFPSPPLYSNTLYHRKAPWKQVN